MITQWKATVLSCVIAVAFFSVAAGPANSQAHALDVRDCFSPILVTHDIRSSETDYEYFYLAMMSKQSFDQIKASGSASGLTPEGFFDGDFSAFQEKRENYFELHQESLKYYQAMASNISFLPPSWQPTIDACIKQTLQNASNGLTYLVVNTNEKRFRLEIKYKSTEGTTISPVVKSSEITGGYVLVGGKQQRTLYPECAQIKAGTECPNINSRSEFVVVRDSPNEPVTFTLNVNNPQSTSFDVDVLPKKIKCSSSYEGSKRRTATLSPVPARLSGDTYGSGGYESSVWTARAIAPGKVTAITNMSYNDETNMHLLNWLNPQQQLTAIAVAKKVHQIDITSDPYFNDDVIVYVGTQNGGPPTKTITITAEYLTPVMTCSDVDWK